jgi:putative ABC transport system permease protein
MNHISWQKVLRDIWSNKGRTALVVLSIAVGVFAFGGLLTTRDVLLRDLNNAFLASNPSSATLTVPGFDDQLVNAAAGMREVAEAEGRATLQVRLRPEEGEPVNMTVTIAPDDGEFAIHSVTPEAGLWPPERRDIVLERTTAQRWGYDLGDLVTVELPDGDSYGLIVTGIVHDLNAFPATMIPFATGYISQTTADWLDLADSYNTLYITVAEGRTDEAHITAVTELVKTRIENYGYDVLSTEVPDPPLTLPTNDMLGTLTIFLAAIGAAALLLSAFLIVNTISAVLAQQVRQIGIMKSIGAQVRQVASTYFATVALFGGLALVVALPLGVGLAWGFSLVLANMLNFDIVSFAVPPVVLSMEAAASLAVPVVAATVPIWMWSRVSVREAISDYGIGETTQSSDIVDRLVERVRGLPRPMLLSIRNTFRRKGRLALTLLTLSLSGAIFISVFTVRDTFIFEMNKMLTLFGFDAQVEFGGSYHVSRLEREIARTEGVSAVEVWSGGDGVRIHDDGSEGTAVAITAVPEDTEFVHPMLLEGRWLQPGDTYAVVVGEDLLASDPDLKVGDTLRLEIDDRDYDWEIVGLMGRASTQHENSRVFVTFEQYTKITNTIGYGSTAVVGFDTDDIQEQEVIVQQMEDNLTRQGIDLGQVMKIGTFREAMTGMLNALVGFMLVVTMLMALVGALGLAGTMSLNVIERTREIGIMRAIGAGTNSILSIVVVEGLIIGLISFVIGSLLSVPGGIGLTALLGEAFFGAPLTYTFNVQSILYWLGLSMVVAAGASVYPAMQASRINVREAMAYE